MNQDHPTSAQSGNSQADSFENLNPTMMVLKSHLLAETFLDRVITLYLSRGDRVIQHANLSFTQKLMIVEAFDYAPDFLTQTLGNLNDIRQRCARDIEHKITNSDVEYLGSPLGKYYTQIKREHKNNLRECLEHIFVIISAGWQGVIENLETDALETDIEQNLSEKLEQAAPESSE